MGTGDISVPPGGSRKWVFNRFLLAFELLGLIDQRQVQAVSCRFKHRVASHFVFPPPPLNCKQLAKHACFLKACSLFLTPGMGLERKEAKNLLT